MDNAARAAVLARELKLRRPPVAVAFVAARPEGVQQISDVPPSACTFWRLAESAVFFAGRSQHYECPVGSMTMGIPLPAEREPAARELVGTMVGLGYIEESEVQSLPVVNRQHDGIVYGPLDRFPLEPDVVVFIVPPLQAMLLAEAADAVALRGQPGFPTMGRPACGALAWSANEQRTAMSLGCIGARTYVEVPDDHLMMVVPGTSLDRLVARLATIARANDTLAGFHGGYKREFEARAAG